MSSISGQGTKIPRAKGQLSPLPQLLSLSILEPTSLNYWARVPQPENPCAAMKDPHAITKGVHAATQDPNAWTKIKDPMNHN